MNITDIAARLQQIQKALDELPVTDKARVDLIKTAIMQGTYHVDTANIAEKLLALETELHKRRQK